jgi:hypothetical protein
MTQRAYYNGRNFCDCSKLLTLRTGSARHAAFNIHFPNTPHDPLHPLQRSGDQKPGGTAPAILHIPVIVNG